MDYKRWTTWLAVGVFLLLLSSSVSAASFSVATQADWSNGTFNGTTADRDANSGVLGIGYPNGTDNVDLQYRLDGSTGKDYSGRNQDLALTNTPTMGVAAVWNTTGIDFEQDNDEYATCEGCLSGTTTDHSWTMSAWFKLESLPTSNGEAQSIMTIGGPLTGQPNTIFSLNVNASNFIECNNWDNGAGTGRKVGYGPIAAETWYHAVCVANVPDKYMELYVNGEDKGDAPNWQSIKTGSTVTVAKGDYDITQNNNQRQFDGILDEVMVHPSKLMRQDVQELYRWGTPFHGNYNSSSFSVPANEAPSQLYVNSSNIDTSGNQSWAIVRTSNGESQTIQLDVGAVAKNYSLNFQQTGGTAWATVNMTGGAAMTTPEINKFMLYTELVTEQDSDAWVNESGDLMTGGLNMTGNSIWDVGSCC